MAEAELQNAHLSTINPDFATLVPAVDAAFKQIWTYNDLTEFRGNWRNSAPIYASIIPTEGFDISHQNITVSDQTKIEIRLFTPQGVPNSDLPLLFVLHGGGWVVGGHDSEASICRLACVRNRTKVLSVDYRR
ncbi:hypothetical protein LTS07_009290 [Exophiala sideris]|nr:hypothetical protein LTS07_009290 [Exophiala sideris]